MDCGACLSYLGLRVSGKALLLFLYSSARSCLERKMSGHGSMTNTAEPANMKVTPLGIYMKTEEHMTGKILVRSGL